MQNQADTAGTVASSWRRRRIPRSSTCTWRYLAVPSAVVSVPVVPVALVEPVKHLRVVVATDGSKVAAEEEKAAWVVAAAVREDSPPSPAFL